MSIDLRLSNVDPPASEPKRSIYRDIESLPDPVKLGMTIRFFNYDNVTLYYKITGSLAGWTFGNVALGALATGTDAYVNLDDFASRAKPDAAIDEDITLTLNAYTDAGYTILKWTFSRVVHVVFIDSTDGSWTTDFSNNFDDGTVQGWTNQVGEGSYGNLSLAVATDYVLSVPYSLKLGVQTTTANPFTSYNYMQKTFATPDKSQVYLICNVRMTALTPSNHKCCTIEVRVGASMFVNTVLVHLGLTAASAADQVPINKWMRIVTPITPNANMNVQIYGRWYKFNSVAAYWGYLWQDDFKIISK